MSRKYQITKNSNFWTSAGASPSSGARLGAGVSLRLLPPLALLMMLCGVFFSDSAYAASYINVSSGSGGTVSLGSIKPSATGVSAFGSDTLTITTNCSAGYSVYVSAQNGKDTSLTNSSASSNNTISASSTAVGSAATALSSNTWGINSENNNKYVGLPAYADATNTALITTSSANTSGNNTNTIYYGVKVDTTLTPGTYSGDILYTTLVTEACNNYTVKFNANGGTGEMSDQTIPVGTATSLTMNAFTRPGYMFLGWGTSSSDATPTYKDGEKVTDISGFNTTINLYALWGQSTGNMQDFKCTNLASGTTTYLTDARDNQVYSVYRIPTDQTYKDSTTVANIAGKCLMTKDLSLGYVTGGSIEKGSDLILSTDTSAGSTTGSAPIYARSSNSDWNHRSDLDSNLQYINGPLSGYEFYTSHSYYSYGAAQKVCPKGWRLPTNEEYGTNGSSDTATVGLAAIVGNSADGSKAMQASPWNFILGGGLLSVGWASYTWYGYYWTSTQKSSTAGYHLIFDSSKVYQRSEYKGFGHSVRCIAEDNYTIAYSSTGAASGEASKTGETAYAGGSVGMPAVGTMKKDGYEFKGWALKSGATEATYTAGQTVTISTLLSAAASAGQATTVGSTITLYPVWVQSVVYMQGWSGCSALATNQYLTLRDSRDNNDYVVKKLADGKCWMVQNLRLTNYKLTSADSDVSSDFDLTTGVTYSGSSGWCQTNSSACDDVKALYYNSSEASNSSKSSYYGALYNWYTATAGTGTYALSSGNATSSICPKGWRLPNGGSSVDINELSVLDKAWGGTGTDRASANTYSTFTEAYGTGDNGDFGLAGYIDGSMGGVGSDGRYWTSTAKSTSYAHHMGLIKSKTEVSPLGSYGKYLGRSVRCIADETMQGVEVSKLPESATTTLIDSRDEQKYTVYRWPSTGTAGTAYPTGMAGYAIMTKDLSLGYVTGGSVTKGSNLVLSTSDSAGSTTSSTPIYNRTGTSDWSSTDSDDNLQYINGPSATGNTYSTHSYYSYGAAQKVCPKGWRPPTDTEYDSIRTFMGGNNSTGSSKIRGTPYNFVYGGSFRSSGWSSNVGNYGLYWAFTQYSSTRGYDLAFGPSYLGADGGNKYYGQSVRCIREP